MDLGGNGRAVDVEIDTIGLAIGRIPSGCSILTAVQNGRSTGLLVSWVQQASFDPPMLSVCMKRGRPATELVDASKRFLLNIIGDDPSEMFKHFGKGYALDEDAFVGLGVRETDFGPLIETCIAHVGCEVIDRSDVGDHILYVGEAVAGGVVDGASPYVHLRKSGSSY